MTSRITLNDSRWFSDYRSPCIIENEVKNYLQVKDANEYRQKLQKDGNLVYSLVQKVPQLDLQKQSSFELQKQKM